MNKTSFTKIFLSFFLLVGIEHTNASSTNLRLKRKTTATTTSFVDAISSMFMKDDWSCCDGTNDPTATPSSSPIISVTSTPTTSQPTFIPSLTPTSSPTYMEKKLTASDGEAEEFFGSSCSMSNELIVIGGRWGSIDRAGAYLYHLNGNEIKKLTPGDGAQNNDYFGYSVSMDEKVVIGTGQSNYVEIFSLEGDYERSITCDDCYIFGQIVEIHGERIVTKGYQSSSNKLFIHTIEGELLKTIDNGDDYMYDVDISDEVVVFTTELKTVVYSNSDTDFEKIVEIPQGGTTVATSGDMVVIADYSTNDYNGDVWLYSTDGTFIKTLEHDGQRFGWSVDITDEKIIVGAMFDDEVDKNAGSVFIYSAATGDFQEKVLAALDGEVNDYFGSCVSASDSYYVVGARGVDDKGFASGAAYLFPLSD